MCVADNDQRRLIRHLDGRLKGILETIERDVLAQVLDVPAVALIPFARVLGERKLGVTLDRDVVAVIEDDQPAEPEMAGQ